jgi:hypothetical protein
MLSLTEHFAAFLQNIQPNEVRAGLARDIPAKVREYLKDSEKILTVDPHSRLSGSYARNTAIKEIKDVDILLIVDPSYGDGEDSALKVINKLVSALDGLPKALGDEQGYIESEPAVKRQRRSVRVHITINGQELDLDIVPSIGENGIEEPLSVPDRDLTRWISSDPLGYGRALSALNKEQSNKIVPLIKMFKHWRDVQMKRHRPKSYWLESLVHKHAKAGKLAIENSSYGELFLSLMIAIQDEFQDALERPGSVPIIKDPMLGNNVAKSWTRAEFETFMSRIDESRKVANRALITDDEEEAIKLWQRLFNDDDGIVFFPQTVDETLREALAGKGLLVTSSGSVLARPSTTEKSWSIPAHRNFGEDHDPTT